MNPAATIQATLPGVIPPRRPPLELERAFPGAAFVLILGDPPWEYRNWSLAKNGSHKPYYPSLPIEALEALSVPAVAARNAVLLLWATGPNFPDAICLMAAWGFRYITIALVWHKTTRRGLEFVGPGWHTKPSTEFLLLGKRGRGLPIVSRRVRQVFRAPVRGHSVKPEEVYPRIDQLYGAATGPRLELFARRGRPGWWVWGDEVGPWEESPERCRDGDGLQPAAGEFGPQAGDPQHDCASPENLSGREPRGEAFRR